ncbi:hypothetical protein BN903_55 [Halorubrum sp. AJ67]|nr:hypothetical protein BN903_55 [Halorubrum sp. AJ67]
MSVTDRLVSSGTILDKQIQSSAAMTAGNFCSADPAIVRVRESHQIR